mmetsp:Transcript_4847/g.17566  ORF Transcript_4847/g.17566 Transcript_4847/m.17566 type:complete len:267 (-) Transcript_4847:198-998(-)
MAQVQQLCADLEQSNEHCLLLETRVAALESKNAALKQQVEALQNPASGEPQPAAAREKSPKARPSTVRLQHSNAQPAEDWQARKAALTSQVHQLQGALRVAQGQLQSAQQELRDVELVDEQEFARLACRVGELEAQVELANRSQRHKRLKVMDDAHRPRVQGQPKADEGAGADDVGTDADGEEQDAQHALVADDTAADGSSIVVRLRARISYLEAALVEERERVNACEARLEMERLRGDMLVASVTRFRKLEARMHNLTTAPAAPP